jgi:hypothetical protein
MNENQVQPPMPTANTRRAPIILILLQIFGTPFIFLQMVKHEFSGRGGLSQDLGITILVLLAIIGLVVSLTMLFLEGRRANIIYIILLITSIILTLLLLFY